MKQDLQSGYDIGLGTMDATLSQYVLCAAILVVILWVWQSRTVKLRQIPTLESSFPVLAYMNGLKFRENGQSLIKEAYRQYATRGGICKVSMTDQWLVLLSDQALVDELKQLPEEVASLRHGLAEVNAVGYVVGHIYANDTMHVDLVREKLAHDFSSKFSDIKSEIWKGFEHGIGVPEDWHCVNTLATITSIVTKTANRIYIGEPHCQDREFLSIVTAFRAGLLQPRIWINLFPPVLKPLVAFVVASRWEGIRPMHQILAPLLRERRARLQELLNSEEEWSDKPDDVLMWLLEQCIKRGYSDEIVTLFFLMEQVPAIDTTSFNFVQALYYLAESPSFAATLREEIEVVLHEDGGEWKRSTLHKLFKMDSFLKESMRLNGIFQATVARKAMKDITFSSGITIPRGTLLSAASAGFHADENMHDDPEEFRPWRHVNRKTFVATSTDYLPFGHGRQACPGRHFAALEMKLMMAYVVLHYDVAFAPENNGVRPRNLYSGHVIIPDPTARIMFRRKVVNQ